MPADKNTRLQHMNCHVHLRAISMHSWSDTQYAQYAQQGVTLSWSWLQVVNAEDLEAILGPRPFRSTELRNIDKFRDGFKKQDLVDSPQAAPTPSNSGQPSPGVVDVPPVAGAPAGIGVEKPGGSSVDKQTAESSAQTGRTVAS